MPRTFTHWLTKAAIIGSALLLAGCSTLRLAYNSAPQLTWWWIDGYLDFTSDQSPSAREAVERWFAWHRQTQLVEYADWLAALSPRLAEPTSPQAVCRIFDDVRQKMQPAFEQAYVQAAALVPQLSSAQLAALEGRYAKNNAEFRRDWLQVDPLERRQRGVKNAIERFERVYGTLDEPQRRIVEEASRVSPFDPQRSMSEREQRQREVLQTMRRWLAERPTGAQVIATLRQLAAGVLPDAAGREYERRLTDHSCKLTADVHNATTPAQRATARRRIGEWEADLRSLAGDRRTAP